MRKNTGQPLLSGDTNKTSLKKDIFSLEHLEAQVKNTNKSQKCRSLPILRLAIHELNS